MMPAATLTSKGQVTIPKSIRESLGLHQGDRLEFMLEEGILRLKPISRSVRDLAGFLASPQSSPKTVEEIDQAILETVAAEDERTRRN